MDKVVFFGRFLKNLKKRIVYSLSILYVIGGLFSCLAAPVAERDEAKILLEKAESVDSIRFAKEDFDKAKAFFTEALNFFVEKGKSKKNVRSRELFLESSKSSQIAYENSLLEKISNSQEQVQEVFTHIQRENLILAYPEDFQKIKDTFNQTKEYVEQKQLEDALSNSQRVLNDVIDYKRKSVKLQKEATETKENLYRLLSLCKEVKAHISSPKEYKQYEDQVQKIDSEFIDGFFQMVVEGGMVIWKELEKLVEVAKKKKLDAIKSYTEATDMLSSTKKKIEMSSPDSSEKIDSSKAEMGSQQ